MLISLLGLCVALSGCSTNSSSDDPTFNEAANAICDVYRETIEGVPGAQQSGSRAEDLRIALDAGVAETMALARLEVPAGTSAVYRRLLVRLQSRDGLLHVMVTFADDPSPKAFNSGLRQWAKVNTEISELSAQADLDSCAASLKIDPRSE